MVRATPVISRLNHTCRTRPEEAIVSSPESMINGDNSAMTMPTEPTPVELPPLTVRGYDRADMLGRVDTLRGRRLILINEQGNHYDYRAWSDLIEVNGVLSVYVVTEEIWWRYVHLRLVPQGQRWPAVAVWAELAA